MTGIRTSTSILTSATCVALSVAAMEGALAQQASPGRTAPASPVPFDLPAQPLAQVLQAFGRLTELVVVAPRPLLDGRTSAPINGDYLPGDALRHVLAGTG